MILVRPAIEFLPQYKDALLRGWSPNNVTPEKTRIEELDIISKDPSGFCASLVDKNPQTMITLPMGNQVPKLPGYRAWMWLPESQEFVGSIGFRWVDGSDALPDYCLGHIGYAVVPWQRNKGYATRGLALILDDARQRGMGQVEVTTQPDNLASAKVIVANGGVFQGEFVEDPGYGGKIAHRYIVSLRSA